MEDLHSNDTNSTFKHSGDLGDIVFSIPTINALGGGILCLDPTGGESSPLFRRIGQPRTKLNIKSINDVASLLQLQKCIADVVPWSGREAKYDLDKFRDHIRFNNLCISHLEAFKLDHDLARKPWLNFPYKRKLPKPFVISRTPRYHGNYTSWVHQLTRIKNDAIFVGLEKEHEIFEYTFGHKIDFYPTPSILDLAETINSADVLFCNQGLPHAIAEGLHHHLVCEMYRVYPAAIFEGKPTSKYF
jgi:hypothetical protein